MESCNYCKLIRVEELSSDQSLYQRTLKELSQSADNGCTLWVSNAKLSSNSIGPNGPFVETLSFDDDQPTELFCYLNQPRDMDPVSKQLLVLQICK